ncbi:MAG: ketohexokinase [Candidatus Thiodiazotropha sp. (ex Dulcina madagascariensis)]|nr:ketohexokinase [Candidatus Thiodiazotropha sp. (ex Dulcina madagascariensis)]MCU7924924.1 ketohexokinase [Candidatus Thiodiazotropha sp. (ex Dulcina madagascariensis)]
MRVLAVGVATLDIINIVATYPREDDELRASAQRTGRGGNATNTLVVLSRLGHDCSWVGMLADDPASHQVLQDLHEHQVDTRWVCVYPGGVTPTSCILSSQATGSRTIVHYRDLPEYEAADFEAVDLAAFDWLHFEGRNVPSCEAMLKRVRQAPRPPAISLEIEKPREGIERLLSFADVVLLSRAYAIARGCADAEQLFKQVRPLAGSAVLFAAWGEAGGWLQAADGVNLHQPAFQPPVVVDTLGAGDVFNAGVIHGLLEGGTPVEALATAVRLAGEKCGRQGL